MTHALQLKYGNIPGWQGNLVVFLVVLAALAAGIVYYTGDTQTPTSSAKPTLTNLTTAVRVVHPAWSGEIVPLDSNKVQRKGHSDTGRIENITNDSFAVVWDKWDIEIYKRNPKTGVYHLYDKKPKTQAKK